MPKRQSDRLEDDLERLFKKVKKLEKKIRTRDHASSIETVPSNETKDRPVVIEEDEADRLFDLNPRIPDDYSFPDDGTQLPTLDGAVLVDHTSDQNVEIPCQETSTEKHDCPSTAIVPNTVESLEVVELDEDILEILGDDPTSEVKRGPETRREIASRFQHIAAAGLTKESRKELINKYPLPANCLNIGAPSINPEIKAALTESNLKKDKGIEAKQNEMACAISGLAEVISLHLSSKEKNTILLQKLMDIGRILCDIQHADSVTRRNFILFTVKHDMQEHLKNTKIDRSLFGEQLGETIKSAKAVNKSGADLKAGSSNSVPPKRTKPPVTQTLNRKAAPPRRPLGAAQYAPRSRNYAAPRAPPPPPPAPAPAYRKLSTQQQQAPPPPTRRRY